MTDRDLILLLQQGLIGVRTLVDGMLAKINAHLTTIPPVEPPVEQPPTNPTPPSNVEMRDLGSPSGAHRDNYVDGQVYCYPCKTPYGMFSMSQAAGGDAMPGNAAIQICISQTVGDMSTATSFGVESPGLRWATSQDMYNSRVVVNQPAYINVRAVGGTGKMDYFWNQS